MMDRSFFWGAAAGMTAGTCLGMRMQAKRKQIRRGIQNAARKTEDALNWMTRQ